MTFTIQSVTAEQFLQKAGAWLEQEEAKNNLILGMAHNLVRKPVNERQEHRLFIVEEDGNPVGAAAWTPPYKIAMTQVPKDALEVLADRLFMDCPDLPGVDGPKPTVDFFASVLARRFQKKISLLTALRIFQLNRLEIQSTAKGRMRKAQAMDLERLDGWYGDFSREVKMPERIEKRQLVEGYIREQRLFVWEDGKPTAMAGYSGNTPHGIRVNMVYTPPPFRNRGYATSLVATLSRSLLDSGKQFCFLFADLSNPTSNAIYQRIGYRPVCDWDVYAF